MSKMLLGCWLALAVSPVWAGEVWKCRVGDKIHYADQPCASQGEPLSKRTLQPNVVDTSADNARRPVTGERAGPDGPAPSSAPMPPSNVCPSDRDLTAMETRANANSLSPEAKTFMQDEIRRARQCRKGQGNYTAADWDISRQAQDAQSSLSGGADARRRAEAMHSAADVTEGDRIARQREQEQAQREAQRRLEQRLQNQPPARPASAP